MSNGRVEVMTSVERRRRWSTAKKEELIAATLAPGGSVSAVARGAGIHPSQLYGWRRQLCGGAKVTPSFAAVRVMGDTGSVDVRNAGVIEIEFAGGARMRITGAAEPATVRAAVTALAEGGRR